MVQVISFFYISDIMRGMIKTLWMILFYKPLYNGLIFLVDHMPNYSMFLSVILLTIVVRFIIAPLSYKSIRTQLKTKALQPELKKIQKTITDKQEQGRKTLELYKKHKVNPFSSFLLMLVQMPIILALYWVFRDIAGGVDASILYSFIQEPEMLNLQSFGINLTEKSYLLAFLAGVTQYLYLNLSTAMKKDPYAKDQTEQEKMMSMVGQSMKFTMPIMITFFAYIVGGAVALYWVTSNIFMIFQELYIQKKLKKENEMKVDSGVLEAEIVN